MNVANHEHEPDRMSHCAACYALAATTKRVEDLEPLMNDWSGTEKFEPAYLATVYHDDEDNAATDSKAEWLYSFQAAAAWARDAASDYWNGVPATVHYGYVVKSNTAPPRWEDDDREAPWLIYADSEERDG